MNRLLVIITEGLSQFVQKGEVIDRYYNPGDFFQEVHILMLNSDQPPPSLVQRMVGNAKLYLHNYPGPRFLKTLGWRPTILRRWAQGALRIADQIRPNLVRCYANSFNGFVAREYKRMRKTPYIISLHINPDEDIRNRAASLSSWLSSRAMVTMEKMNLDSADLVLPVYQPIIPYLRRLEIENFEIAYNVLNPASLSKKTSYDLSTPVKVVSVGRQIKEKNPDQLIRAVADLPQIELTLIGDGTHHEHLRRTAEECKIEHRVRFHRALPNDEVCKILAHSDIFATHTEYWEISKSVLEPLLTGLPLILNRRIGAPVPELNDDICLFTDNSKEGYKAALQKLLTDHKFRKELGERAYKYARNSWSPEVTEQNFVRIYQKFISPKLTDLPSEGVV